MDGVYVCYISLVIVSVNILIVRIKIQHKDISIFMRAEKPSQVDGKRVLL